MQNRSLPQLDELYKEIILEHYREPKGRTPLERVDYQAEGLNPLCGDEVQLGLQVKDGKIDKVHIEGHGCSISVASGSMLAQILKGKTIDEAKALSQSLKEMMRDRTEPRAASSELRTNGKSQVAGHSSQLSSIDIGDLEALEGVKKFPVRIKCALLPWTTMEEALSGHSHIEIS